MLNRLYFHGILIKVKKPNIKKAVKMVTVALVNPPLLKERYRHQPYLPIGLAYLATVLEKEGHNVTVIDCPTSNIDYSKLENKLRELEPDMVGITAMTPTISSALICAEKAKKACPKSLVILGGPHATFMDEEILRENPSVDIVVRGEGEQTIKEIGYALEEKMKMHEIDGITLRRNGEIFQMPNRELIDNMDSLPYPSFKHFPLEKYKIFGRRIMPIITSRGCPFQCSFCITSRIFGKKVRMRSPKNVVDELEWLKTEYDAEAYSFYDDTFTFSIDRAEKICEEMVKRGINLPWDCQTRADRLSRELLAKMKRAGCEVITMGIESASAHILNLMGKGTTPEQNRKAVEMIKKAGISVVVSVIIGYPDEKLEDVKHTLDFVAKIKPDDVYVCVATPYPGTKLYDTIMERGWKMSPDWSMYDTITPVFENPLIPKEKLIEVRREFYDSFYSPAYVLRQIMKGGFYNRILARVALNHIFWRIRSAF